MRVLFAGGGTGGHLYPALAIARALKRHAPEVQPYFIGARRGIERDVLPTTEFPFTLLELHPLYRSRPWRNWGTFTGMLGGLRTIARLAREDRPALVVATGGYASGAALAWARWSGVPYALQEQNSFPGKTVRYFAPRARAIFLGFPEATRALPPSARLQAVDTGNPIEPPPSPRPDRSAARVSFGLPAQGGRVLLAFGGSQGSAALNGIVEGLVARGLPSGLSIIWGTGREHFPRFASLASRQVAIRPYLAPISEAYAASDLALTRAGAMTTAELCAWGVPMILIPLPTAAADHQTANAKALAQAGAARWLPQAEASVERVDALLREQLSSDASMGALAAGASSRARPKAADDIAQRIVGILRGEARVEQ